MCGEDNYFYTAPPIEKIRGGGLELTQDKNDLTTSQLGPRKLIQKKVQRGDSEEDSKNSVKGGRQELSLE